MAPSSPPIANRRPSLLKVRHFTDANCANFSLSLSAHTTQGLSSTICQENDSLNQSYSQLSAFHIDTSILRLCNPAFYLLCKRVERDGLSTEAQVRSLCAPAAGWSNGGPSGLISTSNRCSVPLPSASTSDVPCTYNELHAFKWTSAALYSAQCT
jgi:hypothetical protein